MQAFEIESLLPRSLAGGRRSHLRVKELIAVIIGLVLVAIGLNLSTSFSLSRFPGDFKKKKNPASVVLPTISDRKTVSPTRAPLIVQRPVSGPVPQNSSDTKPLFSDKNISSYVFPVPPTAGNASQLFTERWCDLSKVDWFPKDNLIWQLRAPYFLLPGAKFSGVDWLESYLLQHPQIVPPNLGDFFYEQNVRKYVTANEQTKVFAARHRLYARSFPVKKLQKEPSVVSYDASSGYLFHSSVLPRRLLCVWPWAKLIIVLSHPTNRLLSHYEHTLAHTITRGSPISLEEWIQRDIRLMNKTGLLKDWTKVSFDEFFGSKDEDVAWYEYCSATIQGAIGRSLYAIQLRQWFQALRAVGRNPTAEVMIVQYDDLLRDPQRELNRVFRFLGLPDAPIHPRTAIFPSLDVDPALRQRLDNFFVPYNQKLTDLLRAYKIPFGSDGS